MTNLVSMRASRLVDTAVLQFGALQKLSKNNLACHLFKLGQDIAGIQSQVCGLCRQKQMPFPFCHPGEQATALIRGNIQNLTCRFQVH